MLQTKGDKACYLKLAGVSSAKLEHYFLFLGHCKGCFSVFRSCTQDSFAGFKELFHHGVL